MLHKNLFKLLIRAIADNKMKVNEKLVPIVLYKQSLSSPNLVSSGGNYENNCNNNCMPITRTVKANVPFKNVEDKSGAVSNSTLKKTDSYSSVTKKFANLSIKPDTKSGSNGSRPISTFARFLSTNSTSFTSSNSLEDIAQFIRVKKVKKIVIMAGAGISTNSGIPDFRTPGSGLYDNLKEYKIPFPEAIFDMSFFHVNPRPFYTLAKELYPNGKYRPNSIHYFFRLLHEKGMLLKIYTQNIDGLERLAGLPPEKLVEAHGTFATATCQRCRLKYRGEDVYEVIKTDQLPRCTVRNCQGIIKPDIVFFGEDLPIRFYSYMSDFREADMLFVMGTSLEVEPFAGIVDSMRNGVPRVLFNMKAVGPFKRKCRAHDVVAAGDIVDSIERFADLLSWKDELINLMDKEESAHVATTMEKNDKTNQSNSEIEKDTKMSPVQNGIKKSLPRNNLLQSSNQPNSKPFNKGYSTHAPLIPIGEPARFPSLSTKQNNSRNNLKTVPSRNNATRQEFRRPVGRGRGRRKISSSSSSTSSSDSSSSSSSY